MVFVKADPCGCQATNARFYLLDNYIDGTEFVALSEAEIKEMVPPIGLAKKIMKLNCSQGRHFVPCGDLCEFY